jgi:hypothetical protein
MVYHRDGGSLELAEAVISSKDNYYKIYLTGTPNDLTPWFGFVGNWDVSDFIKNAKYRKSGPYTVANIEFSGHRCPSEIIKNPGDNVLLVDAEGCNDPISDSKFKYNLEFTIFRPDGSWVYKGWKTSRS